MIKKTNKNQIRMQRHYRLRHAQGEQAVKGTPERPRLCVYRSTSNIYAQVIDDVNGKTLCSACTLSKTNKAEGTKTEAARKVGEEVAKKALKKGVKAVVFDRGGYLYTGRIKALADAARSAGLNF